MNYDLSDKQRWETPINTSLKTDMVKIFKFSEQHLTAYNQTVLREPLPSLTEHPDENRLCKDKRNQIYTQWSKTVFDAIKALKIEVTAYEVKENIIKKSTRKAPEPSKFVGGLATILSRAERYLLISKSSADEI